MGTPSVTMEKDYKQINMSCIPQKLRKLFTIQRSYMSLTLRMQSHTLCYSRHTMAHLLYICSVTLFLFYICSVTQLLLL